MTRCFCLYRRAFTTNHFASNVFRRAFSQSIRKGAGAKLRKLAPPLKNSTVKKPGTISGRFEYPEAIRIYSRSGLRLALLGTVRLAPFVLVIIWTIQIGASILNNPANIDWTLIASFGAALLPILLVVPMTSGYVAWILIRLPPEARRGKDALLKWVQNGIPLDTLLEIKSVRANGFSRATDQCTLAELQPYKPRFLRQANFERVVDPAVDGRRVGSVWKRAYAWLSEPPRLLKIAEQEGLKSKMVKAPFVWPEIVKQINKRGTG